MSHPVTLALAAIFVWWFSTGAILLAVRRADRRAGGAHVRAVLAGLPLLVLGCAAVALSLGDSGVMGVYSGFLGALAIWGWIELAFLAGVVAGPMRAPCPPGLTGLPRFQRAWATVAHHELLLTFALLGLVVASQGAQQPVALWTYAILFFARISAKLNLFFGVPRINVEFVPNRLDHLKSYFRQGPITPAFPVAVTLLTFAVGCFAERLWAAETTVDVAAFTLLTALSALALLEHWLMVLPLPDAKLWRWMLPAPKDLISKESR
jgi:putative photosynthetic complex assembly protein 2